MDGFNTVKSSIALSVVSMGLLSPHKMAEIRPVHSNVGVPNPRILSCLDELGGLLSLVLCN